MTGTEKRAGVFGLGAGLCLALTLVSGWVVPGGRAPGGADVRLTTGPSGELAVSPRGPLLDVSDLRPGADAGGRPLVVRNQTAVPLTITPKAEPAVTDLDDAVLVELAIDGTAIGRATVRGLRAGGAGSFVLAPGGAARLTAKARLAPGAVDYQGRVADVGVQLVSTPVGR